MGSASRKIRRERKLRKRQVCRAVRIAVDRCVPTFKLTGCTVSIPSEEAALGERVISVSMVRLATGESECVESNSIVPKVWESLMLAAVKRIVDRTTKETDMTDRLPQCADDAVAELTPVLFAIGITLVRVAGFPPIVEVHAGENVLTVNGIGDGKDSWKAAIQKAADKLIADHGALVPEVAPPAPPAPTEIVQEDPPAPVVDPTPAPVEGVDGNGSPVVDPTPAA